MNDQLSQSLALFIGSLSTVVLWIGAYYWGPGKRQDRSDAKEIDDDYRRGRGDRRHRDRDYEGPDRRRHYYDDDEGDRR